MEDKILASLMRRIDFLETRINILTERIDAFFEVQIEINRRTLERFVALEKDEA